MNKNFYLRLFFLRSIASVILLLLIKLPLVAQTNNTDFIQKQLNEYNQQTLQEKVFVHTDRSSYVAGEIIWFKVYCANGTNNHLSDVSKVAYVEVLDKDQQPVLQGKIALKDGTGSGSFTVPLNIHSGNFLLRSYTNWMKNFDPEFYFHQNLTLINTVRAEVGGSEKIENNYEAQFFPEGGNLVDELESNVAFRVTDNSGKGIVFNGAIVEENNDTIVRFRPARFGIGRFKFTPRKGKHYKAFLRTENGNVVPGNLPQALTAGYVLNVSDATANGSVKINVRTNTSDNHVSVVIHSMQNVKAAQVLNFNNGNADFQIDKKSLGDGISSITVFNELNQPVCERLYFKKPAQQLLVDAAADKSEYSTRRKITIDVSAKDEGAKPEASEMSMAVFLLDSLPFTPQNIYNYLWMSSDLKGIVESPEYYFENNSPEASEATDNLMLTHGWRRFKWEEVLGNKKPAYRFLPEYEGHIVAGKMVNKFTEDTGAAVLGFLSVPGPLFHLYAAKSADDGNIYFNTKNFYGPGLVVAQPKKPEADSFRLDISNPFSENFSSVSPPIFSASKNITQTLLKRSINMQVQNVYTGEKLNIFHKPASDTTNFFGKPQVTYMLDDYTRFPTMEEVLREYVREINVRKRRDNFTLTTVSRDEFGLPVIKEPVVLLDGVPQFDNGNKISHYDPLKVKKLEVIQERYFLGPANFDGIASFSTYNGDLEGFRLDTASTVLDYEGMQVKREFYSPVYETADQATSRLPDFRSLLYWSPDIKTDASGKKEVTFYTSQVPGRYAVVLQGMSKDGRAGSKVFTINVKEQDQLVQTR